MLSKGDLVYILLILGLRLRHIVMTTTYPLYPIVLAKDYVLLQVMFTLIFWYQKLTVLAIVWTSKQQANGLL